MQPFSSKSPQTAAFIKVYTVQKFTHSHTLCLFLSPAAHRYINAPIAFSVFQAHILFASLEKTMQVYCHSLNHATNMPHFLFRTLRFISIHSCLQWDAPLQQPELLLLIPTSRWSIKGQGVWSAGLSEVNLKIDQVINNYLLVSFPTINQYAYIHMFARDYVSSWGGKK